MLLVDVRLKTDEELVMEEYKTLGHMEPVIKD